MMHSRDRPAALEKTQNHDTGYREETKSEIGVKKKGEHCGVFDYTLRIKPEKVSPRSGVT